MNRSSPANSTISSNLPCVSRSLSPSIAALRIDVLATGELRMEARPDLEQRSHPPPRPRDAGGRERDPRENLEERRLARAVQPDDADHLALGHLEAHVAQSPELLGRLPQGPWPRERRQRLPERPIATLADDVALAQTLCLDHGRLPFRSSPRHVARRGGTRARQPPRGRRRRRGRRAPRLPAPAHRGRTSGTRRRCPPSD